MGNKLKNAPLIEAIFEIKWLPKSPSKLPTDPHYSLIIGRLFDRLEKEYPFHEPLPTAQMPIEIANGIVQHRLRKGKNQWPVVQLGPGIFTVNDTAQYKWEDFKKRVINGVATLYQVYPNSQADLKVNDLVLRYINAIQFDFERDNIVEFLKGKDANRNHYAFFII